MEIWDSIDTDGPTTVAQITGLEAHMTYAVRVQAKSVNDRWSNMTDVKIVQFAPQGMLYESRHEKTCLQGFRQGKTQTSLLSHRS